MWSMGRSRGNWEFWKDTIGIFSPDKQRKEWKYTVRPWMGGRNNISLEESNRKTLKFKRMPHRWIPEFDKF